jgi:hypothetical protein
MNRWTRTAFAAVALVATAASAQITTEHGAPLGAKPALIAVSATPPVIQVDGKPDRLSPGARIHDRNNRLMLSASLAGQTLYTVYKRDAAGLVHQVWLLDAEEYKKLGGNLDNGDPEGYKRFNELLDLIWASRWLLLK